MNTVQRKWNSQQGASLLIALVFVILALMVGAVVLTAASSNVGRITHNRQDQREYLAVSSAADLLREDLTGMTLTGSYTETVTRTTTINGDGEEEVTESAPTYDKSAALTGSDLLASKEEDFSKLYYSTLPDKGALRETAPAISYPLRFSADEFDAVPGVAGTMTAKVNEQGNYEIDVLLYCETEDGDGSNPILMVFLGTPSVKTPVRSETPNGSGATLLTTEYKTVIEWNPPEIGKGVL